VIPLDYWLMRTLRRATPQRAVDLLLDRGIYLKPGADTSEPARVAREYAERVAAHGLSLRGKTVCVVGYGGSVGIGLQLLEQGAATVVLQDPFASTRRARDRSLDPALRDKYGPDRLVLVHEQLDAWARRHPATVDVIVSNSVLEHVADVPGVVAACAALTAPGGLNIHLVDLRDHYFKYPFEMLCYSEPTWRRWLNASNNLNRWRLPDHERAFRAAFAHVDVTVVEHLRDEFRRARPRIRPEFLTGDESIDAATGLRIEAR